MHKNSSFIIKAAIAILVIQALTAVGLYFIFSDWTTRGQFGDMFGVINSLFSGLAFAGLIYTIFLQQQELSLQREELQLTRVELARSAEASEKSEKALVQQATAANQSARLAAINYLLAHYKTKLDLYSGMAFIGNDPRLAIKINLETKQEQLLLLLDSVFHDVVGDQSNVNLTKEEENAKV